VAPSDPVVRCVAVTRSFATPSGVVAAVDHVDLDAHRGAFTVVAGPSGSGKSTLLGLVACLDRPDAGTVELAGVDVARLSRSRRRAMRRDLLAIVLPQPSDNLFDRLDAAANVRWSQRLGRRHEPALDVADLLAPFGLADATHRRVRELSGGEQQRLALACALARRPTLLVCDEPTASLDRASASDVVAVLRTAADDGQSVLVATHDPDVIAAADAVIRLDHGRRT
jgi:putative ABC transport system ATP-binding protein